MTHTQTNIDRMRDAAGLARFVHSQRTMMLRLEDVAAHGPPGAWIGAGFLRNAVWDALTGRDPDATPPGPRRAAMAVAVSGQCARASARSR